MVGSRKSGQVGNGSGRERESRVYFVPDRDYPTPSRLRPLFPSSTVPTYSILFPSRRNVYCRHFPSRRPSSCSHPIPTFAHNFSHPATHRCSHPIYYGFPSSHTISPIPQLTEIQMFPSHLLWVSIVFLSHHTATTMDATDIFQFWSFNFGCNNHLQQ